MPQKANREDLKDPKELSGKTAGVQFLQGL